MANKKYKKGPTKEEKEALSKKKKFETKWLNKNRGDQSPLKLSKGDLTIRQLRYGTIESHDLISVTIGLDTIKFKSSWIEFIILMLYQIIEEHPDNFKELLGKNYITNTNFCVEKVYGSYSFDNHMYQVYKIFDTEYYLEAKLDSRVIFNSMAHLIRALDINPSSLRFHVESKSLKQESKETKVRNTLRYKTTTCGIQELLERLENNEHLAYIKFFDEVTEVHRLDMALLAFCNIVYDKYGMSSMLGLQNNDGTGICLNELSTDYPCARIRNSLVMVYSNGNTESIVTFIENAIDKLKINESNILFGFKDATENKKEWEVD